MIWKEQNLTWIDKIGVRDMIECGEFIDGGVIVVSNLPEGISRLYCIGLCVRGSLLCSGLIMIRRGNKKMLTRIDEVGILNVIECDDGLDRCVMRNGNLPECVPRFYGIRDGIRC